MSIKLPSLSAPLVLARGGCLQPRHLEAYRAYLISRGHATGYMRQCEAAVMYFASWLKQQGTRLSGIDECLVAEFIERHVKRCGSATTTRSPTTARAALGHLVIFLKKTGAIPPKPQDTSPVAEELRRYDVYMSQVRGLTSNMSRPTWR